MTMVELGTEAHTAKLEGLATSLDDRAVALFEAVDVDEPSPALAEIRAAAERLLADPAAGRETAALLVAEVLRLVDRFGIRAAARVDDRVVVAVATGAGAGSPSPARRTGWSPAEPADCVVSVTEFGRLPGPYLAGLSEGRPFGLSRRANRVVEIHPLTEAEARRAKLYDDPALDPEPFNLSKFMDNPSGVLRWAVNHRDRVALLRKNNVVVGLVVPAAHPYLRDLSGFVPPEL